MRIARYFSLERALLGLVVYGALTATSGCGENKNTETAAPAQTQAEQDAERAAREKAMGKK